MNKLSDLDIDNLCSCLLVIDKDVFRLIWGDNGYVYWEDYISTKHCDFFHFWANLSFEDKSAFIIYYNSIWRGNNG